MARTKRIEEPTGAADSVAADTVVDPDGQASLILRDGPFAGAHDALPEGAVVQKNELHISSKALKVCAVYQVTEAEGGIPTYRLARTEPIY